MPGTFDPASLPKRPGVYTRYESEAPEIILPAFGSVVAVPFTHNWGPVEEARLVTSYASFLDLYGDDYSPAQIAVRGAFLGEGMPGRLGAGAVLCYRMTGSAAAAASRTLQNTTPINAITLTAKYPGTRGDALRVTVQDYAADTTQTELILYYGTVEVERFRYADTNVTDLATQVNATSDWVTASGVTSGVALTPVSSVAFTTTAGNDGATLVAQDWTDMMTEMEVERFSLFAPHNLTDSAIVTALKTWLLNLNAQGRRVMAVVGGAVDETTSTAVTRSTSLNNENIVNVGIGSYYDDNHVDPTTGDATILSSAQLAPRIAGILAQKSDGASATYSRVGGLRIRTGPTEANISTAFDGGVLVLARDADPVAPVHLERSLTTYTTTSDATKPYLIFRNPKFVRTMHIFEEDLQAWQTDLIGPLPVNDKSRRSVCAEAKAMLNARVARGVIQADPTVMPSVSPPPSDNDEYIAIDYGIAFGRSAEQVLNTIRFS